jgi:hypothetical protein
MQPHPCLTCGAIRPPADSPTSHVTRDDSGAIFAAPATIRYQGRQNQDYVRAPVWLPRDEAKMTELEVLDRNAQGLKELLRVAWRDLANPALTPFERREARNQINQYGAELRRHLQLIEAERNRLRKLQAEGSSPGIDKPNFRILA